MVYAPVVKWHATVGINYMVRLLKQVANEAAGEKKHRRRTLWGTLRIFLRRERSWAPVSATA
jgi:hypothetical protein